MFEGSVAEAFASLACADPDALSDRELVDLLADGESVKAAVAAIQARATESLRAREVAGRGDAVEVSSRRSVGAQVGLARRESPDRGRELVSFAAALVADLPHTLEALTFGRISERRAMVIAAETADLDPEQRRIVDERLLGDPAGLDGLGDLKVRHAVRRAVYEIDHDSVMRRREKARRARGVSCRRGWGDGMAGVSGWVDDTASAAIMTSLAEGAARALATDGEDRTRSQVMADLFVSRLTNQPTAGAVPVAVKVIVSAETLLGDADTPGDLEHGGPVPAAVVRQMVHASPEVRSTIQRLFRFPDTDTLVAMESGARTFTGQLRDYVGIRDGWTCRTPYCNAPAVHLDHPVPVREGGPTTAVNAQGLCASCNYTKEHPGWRHRPVTADGDPRSHEIGITSPTGHTYRSRSPGLPPEPAPAPRRYPFPLDLHWAGCARAAC